MALFHSTRRAAVIAVAITGATALGVGWAVALPVLPGPSLPAAAPAADVVVGTASSSCTDPDVATISAAVDAAAAGDTVYVCPGTYPEDVDVDKTLTFLGAQHGVDARDRDEPEESVVGSPTGAFTIASGVDGVTIDGFTLRGSGTTTTNGNGIDAFHRGAGHSFVNTVFADNTNGINLNSTGSAPTLVERNRFEVNNRTGGQGGTGVVVTSGPGDDLQVTDNLFAGHASAAFNIIGDGSNRSDDVIFSRNRSVDDASLAVLNNASGALVERNEATRSPGLGGTGVFIVGNTDGLVVRANSITGGAGVGISANAAFGSAASTDLLIEANLIRNRSTGIRVSAGHDDTTTVRFNAVLGSTGAATGTGFGIHLLEGTDGVAVAKNGVQGSKVVDCRDESTGSGTDGTANMWLLNIGATSDPDGLCLPGVFPPGVPGGDHGDDKDQDDKDQDDKDQDDKDQDDKDHEGGKGKEYEDGKDKDYDGNH